MINDNKTLEDIEELANLMNEQYKDTPFFVEFIPDLNRYTVLYGMAPVGHVGKDRQIKLIIKNPNIIARDMLERVKYFGYFLFK